MGAHFRTIGPFEMARMPQCLPINAESNESQGCHYEPSSPPSDSSLEKGDWPKSFHEGLVPVSTDVPFVRYRSMHVGRLLSMLTHIVSGYRTREREKKVRLHHDVIHPVGLPAAVSNLCS
jgi:hypothetical protein